MLIIRDEQDRNRNVLPVIFYQQQYNLYIQPEEREREKERERKRKREVERGRER